MFDVLLVAPADVPSPSLPVIILVLDFESFPVGIDECIGIEERRDLAVGFMI